MERERPHLCTVCGKKFHQKNQLRQHKIIHRPEEERPFSCYVCARKFNRLHHLKLHLMTHSGVSPHVCEICGRTCRQASDLRKHQLTHKMGKPHACSICGKPFVQAEALQKHMEKHKMNKKVVHACEFCGKQFIRLCHLRKHVESHTKPFVCKICVKSFSTSQGLKQHNLIHQKLDEQFKCEHCGKTFKRAGNLERHSAVHSGEVPYQCTVCGKNFLHLGSHTSHMAFHGIISTPEEGSPGFESTSICSDSKAEESNVDRKFPLKVECNEEVKVECNEEVKVECNEEVEVEYEEVVFEYNEVEVDEEKTELSALSAVAESVDNSPVESMNITDKVEVLKIPSLCYVYDPKKNNLEIEHSSLELSGNSSCTDPLPIMDRCNLEIQDIEISDSMDSQIDGSLVNELANNVLCELDECSLDNVALTDDSCYEAQSEIEASFCFTDDDHIIVDDKPLEDEHL